MRIMKNIKPTSPPPTIKAGIELGLYREIPRHELHPGSWQQEMFDQGRRFYESTGREAKRLDIHPSGRLGIGRVNGTLRYRYADGSYDLGSTVSPEVERRSFIVGSETLDTEIEIVPEDEEAENTTGEREAA